MSLTKEQLEAIRQRAESATAGPWEFYETLCGDIFPGHHDGRFTDADLEFINKAREDIPALLAEIDRLKEIIADREWALSIAVSECERLYEECGGDNE